MITVNFPDAFKDVVAGQTMTVSERVSTVGELMRVLARSRPGLSAQLDDPLYNIAVNDEILLHNVERHPVADGDVVEIIPTMAGG
jgi:molybdopterin converting factor small subunit